MIFALFKAFMMRFWHQTLAATTGSIGARRSHKNLHAHNLHKSYFNGICHGDFGAACSIREMRAEICLGQKVGKNFIACAEELTRIFFMQEQLRFVLLAAFKAINTREFTQSFA